MEQLKTTILVVDDDEDIVAMARVMLEYGGYQVVSETDPLVAETLVDRPDLILADLQMPDIDGPTLIKKLREKFSDKTIPCLLMTAANSWHPDIEAFVASEGRDSVVKKPFDIDVLLDHVKRKVI